MVALLAALLKTRRPQSGLLHALRSSKIAKARRRWFIAPMRTASLSWNGLPKGTALPPIHFHHWRCAICNDYAREIETGRIIKAMKEMENIPPFTRGDVSRMTISRPRTSRSGTEGLSCCVGRQGLFEDGPLPGTRNRLLRVHGAKRKAKSKLKDQHQFNLKGEEWFWIAGIVKNDCFAMLTVKPGPDIAPYHNRQIVVLNPSDGMEWLRLSQPESKILAPLPKGSLTHVQSRKDGAATI
jgi:hypothetical protein